MELRQQIAKWKEELLAPNKSDVLVNLVDDKNALRLKKAIDFEVSLSLPQEKLTNKFFKDHRSSIKESGTPIFGVCQYLIRFELDNYTYCSPLFIASCSIKKNRFNKTYEIEQTEPFYFSPFLAKILDIQSEIEDLEAFESIARDKGIPFSIEQGQWCANFHPHRFILVKELELIENLDAVSGNLQQVLGEAVSVDNSLHIHEGELFNSDEDQRKVFEKIQQENLVIQGPPGTGKSQVIANLMGKILGSEKNAMLVAEKKVALEVIYDKLKTHDLHHFCLLHHHELNAKDFVHSVKTTWEFLENRKNSKKSFTTHSKLAIDGLDLTLNRLRQKDLIGGISFSEFKSNVEIINEKRLSFITNVPDIPVWENEKKALLELTKKGLNSKSWTYIKTKNESEHIPRLEKGLKRISYLIESISIPEVTKEEISQMMRKSGIASLFFYDDLLIPPGIFEKDSKSQKRFLNYYNNFLRLNEECKILEEEKKHWSKNFSLSELSEYIKVLSTTSLFDLRSKFQRKRLLKYTDLNLSDAQSTLQNLVNLKKKEEELIKVKQQLRKLGVSNNENELQHIQYVIRKTQQVDENLISSLVSCTSERLAHYKYLSEQLNDLNDLVIRYLIIDEKEAIQPIVTTAITSLGEISANLDYIQSVSNQTKKIWRQCKTVEELEATIFYSHWKKFEGRYPELAKLDGQTIAERINSIVELKKAEQQLYGCYIQDRTQDKFEHFHALLQTPASKLDPKDKVLKKELRKGKSILVKAFGKSRSFPTIHDLLDSEAKKWISLLHPIFLCSPYTVAKSLPLNKVFDLVIFDEASQLPLPHAVGSLHRSKRVAVAGDQQQMAPHFYFQKNSLSTHDILHQASFYWKNVMLTNHYRSSHEHLIEYSNRYFYEGQLTTFPKPVTDQPIKVIDVDGKFIERINKEEAEITAKEIQKCLKNGVDDIGIVAFSKTQLETILNELPPETQDELMDADNPGFVQSLENVQGDQCSHLIISMGYAPNENGDLHMRFGPLNQEQGHRRLNVLMSRAKDNITFIRSVRASDFAISDNEGVEALRKLMLFLEEKVTNQQHRFPIGVESLNPSTVQIKSPQEVFSSANEMINYYHVLKERGWIVKIEV